jgi:hypothetical protein
MKLGKQALGALFAVDFHMSTRGSPCGLGPFVPIASSLSSAIPLHEYSDLTGYLAGDRELS